MSDRTCTKCAQETERRARRKDFRDNLVAHLILAAFGATGGGIIYLWAIGYTA